jgi:hypothetical protein
MGKGEFHPRNRPGGGGLMHLETPLYSRCLALAKRLGQALSQRDWPRASRLASRLLTAIRAWAHEYRHPGQP